MRGPPALLVIRRVVARTHECGHRVRSGPHPCGALLSICRVSARTRRPCRPNPPALLARTHECGLSARRALDRQRHMGHFPARASRIPSHMAFSAHGIRSSAARCVVLAVEVRAPEVGLPLLDDLPAPRLDNSHDVSQGLTGKPGVVVREVALFRAGQPDFCGGGGRRALADVNVDGLEGLAFSRPELHPVGSDFKNLRHGRTPRHLRTP